MRDPKPQDEETVELDEEPTILDDEEDGDLDEDAILEEYGL